MKFYHLSICSQWAGAGFENGGAGYTLPVTLLKSRQNSSMFSMSNPNELSQNEDPIVQDDRMAMRLGTADDAEKILALQNSIFNTSRTMDYWRWNNEENPYYGYLLAVGTFDGEIVCSYSIIGVKLNFLGSPLLAGQPTNTIVHKDFRKLGFFKKSADMTWAECGKRGVYVGFGFPNEQALPLNLGLLRYTHIAIVKNYRFQFRISKQQPALIRLLYSTSVGIRLWFKSRTLQTWIPKGTTLSITQVVPSGYDNFWEQIRKQEILALWKDSEYLSWRYDRNPLFRPTYFTYTENGTITAMAVTIEHNGAGAICELMVKDNNLVLARLLVNRIAVHYRKLGFEAIKFYGHDRGFFETVFKDFTRVPSQDLSFIANQTKENETLAKLLYQTISWTITSGDFMF